MTQILRFLVERLSFLYAPGRFRFVDSETTASFGGNAHLVMESDRMRLRIVRDRGQLFMDFQNRDERGQHDWYSIDVVHGLITGELATSAELSDEHADFLEEHMEEIESRFAADRFAETRNTLKDLERARAKEMFG